MQSCVKRDLAARRVQPNLPEEASSLRFIFVFSLPDFGLGSMIPCLRLVTVFGSHSHYFQPGHQVAANSKYSHSPPSCKQRDGRTVGFSTNPVASPLACLEMEPGEVHQGYNGFHDMACA